MNESADKVLRYWFANAPDMDKWFLKSTEYDAEIRAHFENLLSEAENGKCFHWLLNKRTFLAHIILLDQFSRHIYRGTGDAFRNDQGALIFASMGIDVYYDSMDRYEKMFALMPFMHSETLVYQQKGLAFVEKELAESPNDPFWTNVHGHTVGHLKVIERFGRFPKRNAALDRGTTPEESAYILETPDLPY